MSMLAAVIMAAGKGTRMKSAHSKVVQKAAGDALIKYVLRACQEAGAEKIITVVGYRQDEVRETLGSDSLYAEQVNMLGTGDAVKSAMPLLEGFAGDVVILSGDAPLVRSETIKSALRAHRSSGSSATVFTAEVDDPCGYGRIVRGENGSVLKITEDKDASEKEKEIREINGGMYCFRAQELFYALKKLTNNNAQGEYYLTDTLEILRSAGKAIGAFVVQDSEEILGINDKYELSLADKILRMRINKAHALNGVYFQNIENTFISPEVLIEPDAEILNGCILEGGTKISSGAVIGPNSHITDTLVGENSTLDNTVAIQSEIGDDCHVGPFAYIRPGSRIGKGCKVGDFVEIKNAVLGDGTKASHLTYIGDCDVGEGVNFGCGTVVVNYDGKKKHRSVIGDKSFIGCNSNLVSPVAIGKGAYVAAGSTITDTVPERTLAIARARQVIKDNWKDKRTD